jgi:RNA polymerase sigma factor CnrH
VTLDLTSLSDGELAALSIAGRDTAFAEIMRRYREPVYRIIAGNIGDADEALDLVQESFVSAHRPVGVVAREIADLPAALREPLVLRTLQDMSQAETAATLSISEKAVETRVRRARARLTERLKDQ